MPVHAIPPPAPFLPALAAFVDQQSWPKKPIILLPSRRACRRFRPLTTTSCELVALGELHLLATIDTGLASAIERAQLPPVMPQMRRVMLLAPLIERFYAQAEQIPLTNTQSVSLALSLGRLMDEFGRRTITASDIQSLVPDQLATHWQRTLDFLGIYTHHWPKLLAEEGRIDGVEHRRRMMQIIQDFWRDHPPENPLIIAGSTASNPASLAFITLAASYDNTHIILPGLDADMSASAWDALPAGHPQYHLKQLLTALKMQREEVQSVSVATGTAEKERHRVASMALLSGEHINEWAAADMTPGALEHLRCVEAHDAFEEAALIARIAHESLSKTDATTLIVCEDANLKAHIISALAGYGMQADDSGGQSIKHTMEAGFYHLIVEAAVSQLNPTSLFALMLHPLTCAGGARETMFDAAYWLNQHGLRCQNPCTSRAGLERRMQLEEMPEAVRLTLTRVIEILTPLVGGLGRHMAQLGELAELHHHVAEQLASSDEQHGSERIGQTPTGQVMVAFIESLAQQSSGLQQIDSDSYAGLFAQFLSMQESYWPQDDAACHVRMMTPMEARLETADTIILAGQNEGCWPRKEEVNPWMSRGMLSQLGLDLPEAVVSRSGHDWWMLLHAPMVYLTRARHMQGKETQANRWWQRLHALIELHGLSMHVFDQGDGDASQSSAPDSPASLQDDAFSPPIAARPTRFSASEIELLIRDPYSIYAKRILKLKPLEPWDQESQASAFGNYIHSVIEQFTRRYPLQLPDDALAILLQMGRAHPDAPAHDTMSASLWHQRFEHIAAWFIETEHRRRADCEDVEAEITLQRELTIGGVMHTLRARMDRFETRRDGRHVIADYKTGATPSKQDIFSGVSSQLPLQAWLLQQARSLDVDALEYWQLIGRGDKNAITQLTPPQTGRAKDGPDDATLMRELIEAVPVGLAALFEHYQQLGASYDICPDPNLAPTYNDYAHLERL